MDLDPQAFWHLTLADYTRKCEGYGKRQLNQWHHTRTVAFTIYRVMGGKDSLQRFMPLEDDTKGADEAKIALVRENIKKIKDIYNGRSSRT
jgi:hypothetical protein